MHGEQAARLRNQPRDERQLEPVRFIVTLDNGTVWSQSQNTRDVRLAVGDHITVRKALLGSNVLMTRDGIATRVQRDG